MVKKYFLFAALVCGVFLFGCGGGGGSIGGTTGSVSFAITDSKPALPAGIKRVVVTINEVMVHQSGGEWISLPLAQTPFTIDLLQFTDGRTSQLVPQSTLTSGKYTQVRLGVQSAVIVTDTGQQIPAEIASGDLKTDKNFDFDVKGGGAVALTVDFDLSQSLIVTGSDKYKLKPVLHILSTEEAATITGSIAAATYGAETQATIIVTQDSDTSGGHSQGDQEYTRLVVNKAPSGPALFSIYWLVPNQAYIVEVQIGGVIVYYQYVAKTSLPAAARYPLNSDSPI
ncbi:MAG: DUF4382 domain-containing protein [Thermodesulfovibrionales bacterium]